MDSQVLSELKKSLTAIAASLQVVGANAESNTQALEQMARRNRETEAELRALRGTFSSLERHLIALFEGDAEMRVWRSDVEARLRALEGRPPAA